MMKGHMGPRPTQERRRIHRKRLARTQRLTILGVLMLLTGACAVATATSLLHQPTMVNTTTVSSPYQLHSSFEYDAYLLANKLYSDPILGPGDGTVFRKITDHINGTFSYSLTGTLPAQPMNGQYFVDATLSTSSWEKSYGIVDVTRFNASSSGGSVSFPIYYQYFEDELRSIGQEVGSEPRDARLVLCFHLAVSVPYNGQTVTDALVQTVNMSLGGAIFSFDSPLQETKEGSIQRTVSVPKDVRSERMLWGALSATGLLAFLGVAVGTVSRPPMSRELRELEKLQRKHKEWIVSLRSPPHAEGGTVLAVRSMEDLVKVSEELGKPILSYRLPSSLVESAYEVIDGPVRYRYAVSS